MSQRAEACDQCESGAVLVAVLIFVTIFGLVLASLLSLAEVNIRTTSSLKKYDARVYAADGGVEYGIETVKTQPSVCADVAAGVVALPAITIGGEVVDVTCRTTAGFSASTNRWAVMTTKTSGTSLIVSNAATTTKFVNGPVYNAGSTDLKARLHIGGAHFNQAGGSGCPAVDQPSNLSFDSGFGFRCTSLTVAQADPKPILPCLASPCPGGLSPVVLPSKLGLPDLLTLSGTCSVFLPGRYSVAPILNGTSNYFASGIYYFDNVGTWTIDGGTTVFAGKQGAGETKFLTQTPCSTDAVALAGVDDGTGAEFIFGGNSQLDVKNGHMEIFLRIPTGTKPEGSAGVSVRTVPSSPPSGYRASDSGLSSSVVVQNGSNPDFAAHGLVYSRDAPVLINATNETGARFLGGVVASVLSIGASAPANGLALSIPSFAPRTITITSTARAATGEKQIRSTAVVKIPNDVATPPVIDSWSTPNP